MEDTDVLTGIAEVAAAFVAFSSIVSLFRPRVGKPWQALDSQRFRNLVEHALPVALLAFVPQILFRLGMPTEFAWVWSSVILGAVSGVHLIVWIGRIRPSSRKWMAALGVICFSTSLILQILNVVEVGIARGSGAYLAGLVLMLTVAALQFGLLVTSIGPRENES